MAQIKNKKLEIGQFINDSNIKGISFEKSRAILKNILPNIIKQLGKMKKENPDEYVFDQSFVESKDGKNVSLLVDMENFEDGGWYIPAIEELNTFKENYQIF